MSFVLIIYSRRESLFVTLCESAGVNQLQESNPVGMAFPEMPNHKTQTDIFRHRQPQIS